MSQHRKPQRTTGAVLRRMKERGEKIACMTAYDASFARILEDSGIDVILVGDSLGMVIQGHDTTIPVTLADMVYHTRCVASTVSRALLMADLPFLSYATPAQAVASAGRLMQEGGAVMVKLEGGPRQVEIVAHLSDQGIPICAHLGLQPQRVHKLGGYRVQGRDRQEAARLLEQAAALQEVGADLLLLECVPDLLAAEITQNVEIPVIGIGAGSGCDGQILVLQDVLGITPGGAPRFARDFLAGHKDIPGAIGAFVQAVREGSFPASEHTFSSS